MKRLLPALTGFVALLLSSSEGWGLPPCPAEGVWTNCVGTFSSGGDTYVGEWEDDKSHGQGTETYANGDKYEGEFENGKPHGQGTYTFADGVKESGYYINDEYVPTICENMGLTKGSDPFGQCVVSLINEINNDN